MFTKHVVIHRDAVNTNQLQSKINNYVELLEGFIENKGLYVTKEEYPEYCKNLLFEIRNKVFILQKLSSKDKLKILNKKHTSSPSDYEKYWMASRLLDNAYKHKVKYLMKVSHPYQVLFERMHEKLKALFNGGLTHKEVDVLLTIGARMELLLENPTSWLYLKKLNFSSED